MKTLDDAVIELNGLLPASHHESHHLYTDGSKYILGLVFGSDMDIAELNKWCFVCNQKQFQQRAKELGFVNGYRYGVEYKTDGKRPNLPDDVLIMYQHKTDGKWLKSPFRVDEWAWEETSKAFKITDPRYRPADTSYLEKTEVATVTTERDAALSAVSEFRKLPKRLQELLKEPFEKALSQFESEAKAKAERDRIISAAESVMLTSRISNTQRKTIARLYDKGFLKLPE